MDAPDYIAPDLGLVLMFALVGVLVVIEWASRRRDRRAHRRLTEHMTTDPACAHHVEPTDARSRRAYDRNRGRSCNVCMSTLATLSRSVDA